MKSWKKSLALLGACALSGLMSNAARADDKYTLRMQLQPGQVWAFDDTIDGNTTMSAPAMNMQSTQKMHTHLSGKLTVNEVANGVPTSVTVAFDPDCSMSVSMTGAGAEQATPQKQQLPVAGQTITIRRDATTGQVTSDYRGQGDPNMQQELQSMLAPDTSYFPKDAVAPGDKYDVDGGALLRAMPGSGPNDRAGMHVDVLKAATINGRSALELKVSAAVTRQIAGENGAASQMQIITQSINDVDLATGQVLKSTSETTVKGGADQQMEGPDGLPHNAHVDTDTKMTTDVSCRLVSGPSGTAQTPVAEAPPTPSVAPAPGPANTPGNVPNTPSSPAPNPFAPATPSAPAAPDFSGTYKGDNVVLVINNDNAAGYVGTIQYGGKTMKLSARAGGNTLTGVFEADGNKFEFTAEVNGATVKFTTAGRTIILQKDEAPKNPFAP